MPLSFPFAGSPFEQKIRTSCSKYTDPEYVLNETPKDTLRLHLIVTNAAIILTRNFFRLLVFWRS
jgi:hypothetical protein